VRKVVRCRESIEEGSEIGGVVEAQRNIVLSKRMF
jgi:hypothetical protein